MAKATAPNTRPRHEHARSGGGPARREERSQNLPAPSTSHEPSVVMSHSQAGPARALAELSSDSPPIAVITTVRTTAMAAAASIEPVSSPTRSPAVFMPSTCRPCCSQACGCQAGVRQESS